MKKEKHGPPRWGRASAGASAALCLAALSACGFFMDTPDDRLPGERVPVLQGEDGLAPSPSLASVPVRLPRPVVNRDWTQVGAEPGHAPHHLALSATLTEAWSTDIGAGRDDEAPLLPQPLVVDEVVFTMDARARVSALDARTGDLYWRISLADDVSEDSVSSAGIAYGEGRVFVTTGFAVAYALDARTGKIIWRRKLSAPMRASPSVDGDRVYITTVDSRLHAISTATGERLWTHAGLEEASGILGSAEPAIAPDVVIAAYASGEVYAIRRANGRTLWSDTVVSISQADPLATIADISGAPVIDDNLVFAVSHSGRMVALNLQTGRRVWEQSVGGTHMPWVAGNFVYVLTNSMEIVCIHRESGEIRWITQLRRFEDTEEREKLVVWSGPVIAGDRALVVSSHGYIGAVSPYTGQFLGSVKVGEPIHVSPVVAGDTLYVLTDDATLMAFR
ncbi:MAG: PQQ-binding-like beta-propeller repeat protein [Alphaproteobacteria bacterium]